MGEYLQAKLKVMQACAYLLKRESKGLSYTFASEADLIALLRPAMIENGISVYPRDSTVVSDVEFRTAKGSVMRRVLVKATFRFSFAGTETYEDVQTHGEAADVGDKATYKAMTGAYKYALRQWAMIETGDDPDKQSSEQYEKDEFHFVPKNLRMTFDRCLAAVRGAKSKELLENYRKTYSTGRGFSKEVVEVLDGAYATRLDELCRKN